MSAELFCKVVQGERAREIRFTMYIWQSICTLTMTINSLKNAILTSRKSSLKRSPILSVILPAGLGSNNITNLSNMFSVCFSLPGVPDGQDWQFFLIILLVPLHKANSIKPAQVFERISNSNWTQACCPVASDNYRGLVLSSCLTYCLNWLLIYTSKALIYIIIFAVRTDTQGAQGQVAVIANTKTNMACQMWVRAECRPFLSDTQGYETAIVVCLFIYISTSSPRLLCFPNGGVNTWHIHEMLELDCLEVLWSSLCWSECQ